MLKAFDPNECGLILAAASMTMVISSGGNAATTIRQVMPMC
jgi:hypothetical protein